jgi:hypothetical protein
MNHQILLLSQDSSISWIRYEPDLRAFMSSLWTLAAWVSLRAVLPGGTFTQKGKELQLPMPGQREG